MKRKLLSVSIVLVFLLSTVGGCSSTQTSNNNVDLSGATLTGTVTSIDGSEIQLSLGGGGMNRGQQIQSPDNGSQPPSDSSGDAAMGEKPSDDAAGEKPSEPASGDAMMGEKPSDGSAMGEQPSGDATGEKPSEPASGDAAMGEQPSDTPQSPDNNDSDGADSSNVITLTITDESVLQDASLSDISEGTMLTVTFDDNGVISSITINSSDNSAGTSADSASVNTGDAANTITADAKESNQTYESSNTDENALRIEGVSYSGDNLTINKTSGDTSDTESSDFYGLNAGVLSLDGADTTLTNATISTCAQGANGVFAYGENTTVTIQDSTITTTANNSGGIDTTGGAATNASNLTITTSGQSSAAIRSDRGGGTVTVDKGTYTTNGTGSPAIYSTADISVQNATLTANASEGVVIEGKNSVTLTDCDVISNMQGTYQGDENENLHAIMLYQSMSGDSDVGEAVFTMSGGSITGQNGDLIYSTNTTSTVNLENVTCTTTDSTGALLRLAGNDGSRGWGSSGSNGADMTFNAKNQTLNGTIVVDEISSLNLNLTDNSRFEGTINSEQEGGVINVSLSDDSTWTLTGDSYITSFDGNLEQIETNGYTLYVDGVAQ